MFPAAPKLVPPSKPDVRQLSDTAVMLNWTVPDNEGLKITFFRVQFKKVGPKKGKWETEDVEIGQDVRTFEVGGLRPRKYSVILYSHFFPQGFYFQHFIPKITALQMQILAKIFVDGNV